MAASPCIRDRSIACCLCSSWYTLQEDPPSKNRGSPVPFTQSPPVLTACRAIEQDPSQAVDVETIHTSYPRFSDFTRAHVCMHACMLVHVCSLLSHAELCAPTLKVLTSSHHRKSHPCCPFPHPFPCHPVTPELIFVQGVRFRSRFIFLSMDVHLFDTTC